MKTDYRNKTHIKNSIPDKIFLIVNAIVLLFFVFCCIYPFYYIFINSLSSSSAVIKGVFLYPLEFTIENYRAIFRTSGIFRSIGVSVARTVLGTVLSVGVTGFIAYLFTYNEMFFKKYLYRFFIFTMYISAGFIPYYLVITKLGLKNNFLVYILPGMFSAYNMILVKTYIESIPASMRESAEIDGAGIFKIYSKIIFPLCMPIIACLVVFTAVGQWNVWSDTLYFITDKNLYTLQYKLYVMLQSNMAEAMKVNQSANIGAELAKQITPTTMRMTMTFVTVVPVLCVYPFMQKYFMKGIMLGAVKG